VFGLLFRFITRGDQHDVAYGFVNATNDFLCYGMAIKGDEHWEPKFWVGRCGIFTQSDKFQLEASST